MGVGWGEGMVYSQKPCCWDFCSVLYLLGICTLGPSNVIAGTACEHLSNVASNFLPQLPKKPLMQVCCPARARTPPHTRSQSQAMTVVTQIFVLFQLLLETGVSVAYLPWLVRSSCMCALVCVRLLEENCHV